MWISCSICKEDVYPHSKVSVVECGHIFHESCINEWCKMRLTCPHCRSKLSCKPHGVEFTISKDILREIDEDTEVLFKKIRSKCKEAEDLTMKMEELKSRVSDLRDELSHAESETGRMRFDVGVMKRELDILERTKGICEELRMENEAMTKRLELLLRLNTLMYGTENELYEILERTPITETSVKELCVFAQAMKYKLKARQEDYKKENLRLLRKLESVQKELLDMEERKRNLQLVDKSVQTDEAIVKRAAKKKLKRIASSVV